MTQDHPDAIAYRRTAEAFRAGAEFVDVEAQAAFVPEIARMRRGDRGLVLSRHFFGEPPADLAGVATALVAAQGHVYEQPDVEIRNLFKPELIVRDSVRPVAGG